LNQTASTCKGLAVFSWLAEPLYKGVSAWNHLALKVGSAVVAPLAMAMPDQTRMQVWAMSTIKNTHQRPSSDTLHSAHL
jgi:hypothetical protein